jgi:hypothetical protein
LGTYWARSAQQPLGAITSTLVETQFAGVGLTGLEPLPRGRRCRWPPPETRDVASCGRQELAGMLAEPGPGEPTIAGVHFRLTKAFPAA